MNQTFQNSAQVLSIGVFFTLMIIGLASTLPQTMSAGLEAHGVSAAAAPRGLDAAAGVDPVRRLPGLQPDPAPARRPRAGRAPGPQPGGPDRQLVLPQPDLRAVPRRAARRLPVRDRRLPDRGRGVADARRPSRRTTTIRTADRCPRSPAVCVVGRARGATCDVEWYGQSSFRLTDGCHDRVHRPVRRHDRRCSATDCAGSTRRSPASTADLLLVTHEHLDHNGVEAIEREPVTVRSTAGPLRLAGRRGGGRRLRARRGRRH